MKIYIKVIIITAVAAFFTSESTADGNKFLEQCLSALKYVDTQETPTNRVELYNVGMCFGLGQGVRNTMQLYNNKPYDLKACFPNNGINNGQATRIIVLYLQSHPALLHQDEAELVMQAFVNAYPCK